MGIRAWLDQCPPAVGKEARETGHRVCRGTGAPAAALRVRGDPWTSHSGACASSVDASTTAGDERMWMPSIMAEIT